MRIEQAAGEPIAAPVRHGTAWPALLAHVDELAVEVGRLRRRCEPDSSLWWLVDRLADRVESLDCITQPSAAELYRDGVPIEQALAQVDRRVWLLRATLGARQTV